MTLFQNAIAAAAKLVKSKKYVGVDLCLQNVRKAYGTDSKGNDIVPGMGGTAYQAWLRAGGHDGPNTHYALAAPAGAPLFYKGTGRAGHIAISAGVIAGAQWIYTTDYTGGRLDGRWHLVKEADLMRGWNMARLGWSETLNGVRLTAHVTG